VEASTRLWEVRNKCRNRIGDIRKIAFAREAGSPARAEVVIAISDPSKANGWRQRESFHFGTAAERVALTLNDERRTTQHFQMGGAEFFRCVGWMKRIAQADQPVDLAGFIKIVGDKARYAPAHRLAADDEFCAVCPFGERSNDITIFGY